MLDRSIEEEIKRSYNGENSNLIQKATPTPIYKPGTNDYFKISDFNNSDDA